MITSLLPFKVLILLLAACLTWIGLLSAAFLALSGAEISSGWILGGALVFATAAWILVMIREIRDSVHMADHFTNDEPGIGNLEAIKRPTMVRFTPASGGRSIGDIRNTGHARSTMPRPRKLRSLQPDLAKQRKIIEFFHPDV